MRFLLLAMLLYSALASDGCRAAVADHRDTEGKRANSLTLNGAWEFALGDGSEAAETPEGASRLRWRPVTLPGPLMPYNDPEAARTRFAWVRRSFTASPEQARGLAVLHWNQITFGAVAFINGRKVGENAPTGPYQTLLGPGVLKAGANSIVLKVAGGVGAPKSRSGHLLIPAGFGDTRQPPAVQGDVWIDFADTAYMKWILALPDLAGSKVRLRATPIGLQAADGLTLEAEVHPWPEGPVVGRGRAPARLVPTQDPLGGNHAFVDVPMPGYKPWTYEEPNLYTAAVTLRRGDRVLDAATVRFGMREITVANGHYLLNGKPLRLRGSELVFEWDWGDIITGKEVDYLATEAREMSMNAFRTHTMPPPPLWANVGDEHGTMILAEFPCLYNYVDYRFTPEEYAVWHRNVLSDAAGWMARLWNHPSVVMWVLSNESNRDREWETGPYHDFVRGLDPTRPTMRTGDTGTAENYDVHTCGNTTDPVEGALLGAIQGWFGEAKGRPVTNSEYMNGFSRPLCQWTGVEDRDADALAYAQLGTEHTEAMRRARLDAMLPYMYAGWTRTRTGKVWKAGFAHPASACWHSALSPVLASLDLFDPDYLTGQKVTTDLALINDSWHDARVHVDLLLTRECPEFVPEAACFDRPVAKWSYDFTLKADSLTRVPVTWELPEQEGGYWLTARTTGLPGRPVLSQRFVRAVKPAEVSASLRSRTVVLLGGTPEAEAYIRSRGLRATRSTEGLKPGEHVVLVWDPGRLTAQEKEAAAALSAFAGAGGRVVVLSAEAWSWPELCDIRTGSLRGSRAFAYESTKHEFLTGLGKDAFTRWNGFAGVVATGTIEGAALSRGERILWVVEPKNTVVAEIPIADGKGRLLFSQLQLRDRLDPSKPQYDPMAERVLLNLLR